jgi:phosphatidylserine/phosphatidylglycerophosphate/cardiolipin synthase-like enzyme
MNIDDAVEAVLGLLSDSQASALATACAGHQTPPSGLGSAVVGAGPATKSAVARLGSAWKSSTGLTGDGVALSLRLGLRARQQAAKQRALPVWTGPHAVGEQRLTAGVLHELISQAHERIVLLSYATKLLAEVSADLNEAVKRGCTVDVVVENSVDSGGYYQDTSDAFADVPGLHRWRWPKDQRPTGGAVLHAKVLVVDGCRALIGSANLTHHALHRNLEAGVLINDAGVAADLETHVRHLMQRGALIAE